MAVDSEILLYVRTFPNLEFVPRKYMGLPEARQHLALVNSFDLVLQTLEFRESLRCPLAK